MALFKLIHSQSHKQISIKIQSFSHSLSNFSRTLCSSTPSSQTNENPQESHETQQKIQPISYPIKPKDPSIDLSNQQSQNQQFGFPGRPGSGPKDPNSDFSNQESQNPQFGFPGRPGSYDARNLSREDIRYVKDMPGIAPVAYPSRVAPLPDDKPRGGEGDEELERERRRIENENRGQREMRRVLRDKVDDKVPFPTLIKVDNDSKKKKVVYDLKDALQLVKASAKRNFDETLEAHVRLNTELRRTDLKLTGSVQLPHGTTKNVRVAVFAEGAAADDARDAGADIVGGLELIEGIKNETVKINFDICYATTEIMRHVKQLGRQLNRLMPKKEQGTITEEVGRAVRELKGSGVLFRKDKTAVVHVGLGKVSLQEDALRENVAAFTNALLLAKPPGLKKSSKYAGYVESFHICSTVSFNLFIFFTQKWRHNWNFMVLNNFF
ncbi:hypothetical protein Leryth_024833 [Lithospermum erythrorhizon]|nr:hypothetical protein Leryth_024833 [Lithospermum erythrorhizon]